MHQTKSGDFALAEVVGLPLSWFRLQRHPFEEADE